MMELADQVQLIREFMLQVAPQVTSHSLETGAGMIENAALTLECSMQLAARYNELHETLTAAPKDSTQEDIGQTPYSAASVRYPQRQIPIPKSVLSDLRQSPEPGRSPSQPPSRETPSPYI
jgi:hypothetical protein